MPKHCQKFLLDRDDEAHFISGIDGSLFIPSINKFHPNDEFCVDYFYMKDDADPDVDEIKVAKCSNCTKREISWIEQENLSEQFCKFSRTFKQIN